jgi:hypothetical protein
VAPCRMRGTSKVQKSKQVQSRRINVLDLVEAREVRFIKTMVVQNRSPQISRENFGLCSLAKAIFARRSSFSLAYLIVSTTTR